MPGVFPFKYVRRGPELKRATLNSLTLQEHLWGITRIIRDESVPQHIKPLLYFHLEEVLDDARSYDWQSAVRPWSEECFSLVAENRLTWSDASRVQMLRTSMSRTSTARLHVNKDQHYHHGQQQNRNRQGYQQNNQNFQQGGFDQLKGGPPCPDFNSERGCPLSSGHMIGGRKMVHVCAYCLTNTASINTHPEHRCRTKTRHANYHFQ